MKTRRRIRGDIPRGLSGLAGKDWSKKVSRDHQRGEKEKRILLEISLKRINEKERDDFIPLGPGLPLSKAGKGDFHAQVYGAIERSLMTLNRPWMENSIV